MIEIHTASWFAKIPEGFMRVSISRSAPRGAPAGWRGYSPLKPGPWFRTADTASYLHLYGEQLAQLDPAGVIADIGRITGGAPAVLLCYESAIKIQRGEQFCHRHIAASWLEQQLGITIEEVGFPNLDRFAAIRAEGHEAPRFAA